MKHSLKFFTNRIGKRIYRDKTTCNCGTCTRVWKEGIVVGDRDHARYLELVQRELDIDYRDKPLKISQ